MMVLSMMDNGQKMKKMAMALSSMQLGTNMLETESTVRKMEKASTTSPMEIAMKESGKTINVRVMV